MTSSEKPFGNITPGGIGKTDTVDCRNALADIVIDAIEDVSR